MIKVEFNNETKEKVNEIMKLKKLIIYAANYMKLDNLEFSVIFVDNEKIKKLNNQYRKIDKETDVLTFRLSDYCPVFCDKINVLGDIFISLDKVNSQALEYGHSYSRELSFLLIHGFLHLLGYDHMNKEDEEVMFKLQEEILDGYGEKR